MTWLLTNGDGSEREFPTREEAEDAKAELAGLGGGDLSIEEKETESAGSADSDELETDYIKMSYDDEQSSEAETADNDDNGECPCCGRFPNCLWRCEFCGRDLAGVRIVPGGRS